MNSTGARKMPRLGCLAEDLEETGAAAGRGEFQIDLAGGWIEGGRQLQHGSPWRAEGG